MKIEKDPTVVTPTFFNMGTDPAWLHPYFDEFEIGMAPGGARQNAGEKPFPSRFTEG